MTKRSSYRESIEINLDLKVTEVNDDFHHSNGAFTSTLKSGLNNDELRELKKKKEFERI